MCQPHVAGNDVCTFLLVPSHPRTFPVSIQTRAMWVAVRVAELVRKAQCSWKVSVTIPSSPSQGPWFSFPSLAIPRCPPTLTNWWARGACTAELLPCRPLPAPVGFSQRRTLSWAFSLLFLNLQKHILRYLLLRHRWTGRWNQLSGSEAMGERGTNKTVNHLVVSLETKD